jgi:hypothetical protein
VLRETASRSTVPGGHWKMFPVAMLR